MKASEQNYLGSSFYKRDRFLLVMSFADIESERIVIFDTEQAIMWLFEEGQPPVVWRQFVRYIDGLKPSYKPAKKWWEKKKKEGWVKATGKES